MTFNFRKMTGTLFLSLGIIAFVPTMASAHCDTKDGPVISDAKNAIESNNINYILKWVMPEHEEEVTNVFDLTMKVRQQGPDAQRLADEYLFENLVRIHRDGEGAAYTGVKPEGTPIAEEVVAADRSIESGDLSAFEGLIPEDKMPELQEKFDQVQATKDFDVNDVEAGRKYIESYVQFTHFAEGEEHGEGHSAENTSNESEHTAAEIVADGTAKEENHESGNLLSWLPWGLAGLFFITTVIAHFRKHKHTH